MDASISSSELLSAIREGRSPLVIDVRRRPGFRAATDMIAGALWRDPERVADWAGELPRASRVVAYCVHGHEVSRGVAKALGERGIAAQYLQGGIEEGWKAAGGALDRKAAGANTRWVTRERPKIDRIACPWLIAQLRGRPRDAQARHGDVRRALRLVQSGAGRGAHVESRRLPLAERPSARA